MRLGLVLFSVVACTGTPGTSDDQSHVDDPTDGTDTDLPGDTDDTDTDDTDVTAGDCDGDVPGICGVLLDPEGVPLAHHDILCCMTETCFKGETGADGSFFFEVEPVRTVALKTHEELFEAPRWAAALVPGDIATPTPVDVGFVYIPDLPAGVELGEEEDDPQTLAVGDGLELTLNVADLDPDLGVFLHDIAAREIPEQYIPEYPGLFADEVEAVYAIHPFATASLSPVPVKAPSDLPPGTLVHFWEVSHLTGQLQGPIVGHADGQFVTTDSGLGIDLLTHLVISVP
jgi:hypothetical protein